MCLQKDICIGSRKEKLKDFQPVMLLLETIGLLIAEEALHKELYVM